VHAGQQMKPSTRWGKTFVSLFVASTIMLLGCQRSSDPDPAPQRSDPKLSQPSASLNSERWDARLNGIKLQLAESQRFTPELFESLQQLHEDAPQHDPTTRLLVNAYLQRQDWNALAGLLNSKPPDQRSAREVQQLATILVRAQRFEEAYALVDPMVDAAGQSANLDVSWLAAFSAFHTGNLARVATILDANFEELIAAGKLDAYVIRALVHFEFDELVQAESLLTTLVNKNDSHAPGHDALGRVLVARGDVERGKQHIGRANELRLQVTTAEQKALRLAAMAKALDDAWNRKDYDTCDRFIAEMLPQVSRDQQVVLYQYLAAVRLAQGRQEEAREAQHQATQLSSRKSES
jgi:hypothetical protein